MEDTKALALLKRKLRGRSQKALAAELGITASYLCDILKGRREPGQSVLDALGMERVITYRSKQ